MWLGLRKASLCVLVILSTIDGAPTEHPLDGGMCQEIQTCQQPFPMLVDLVQKDNGAALATLTYSVFLDHVCSQREELSSCLQRVPCDVFQYSYTGQAILNVLTYICEDGRDHLLAEPACFFRDDFQRAIYHCSKVMKLETDIASLQIRTKLTDSKHFCTVFENMLSCVHINVERACSPTAATFTRAVFAHTIRSMVKQIGCDVA